MLIVDGRIGLGVRLPGERELAHALGVSRTTLTAAYGQLREDGYLLSRRGSGSVTQLPGGRDAAVEAVDDEGENPFIDWTAAALPAPASAERSGASIGDAEGVIAMPLLLALVFVFSIGLVAAVESSEDDEAPVSP